MERSAEWLRGAIEALDRARLDFTVTVPELQAEYVALLADAEAREASQPTAAEVIAAAEKALARYANGPWLVMPNEGFSAKDGSTRKRFAAFEDQGGEIAKEALAEIARWKEAHHGK